MSSIPLVDPHHAASPQEGTDVTSRSADPGIVAQLTRVSLARQGVLCDPSCVAVVPCASKPGWHDVELLLPVRENCDELREGAAIGSRVACDLAKAVTMNAVRVCFSSVTGRGFVQPE